MSRILCVLFALCFLTPSHSFAGDFDGTKLLLCAVRSIIECDENNGCERVAPEEVHAPAFFRLDFDTKTIRAARTDQTERTSKIKSMERLDGKLILQGADDGIEGQRDGLAWSAAIGEDTGRMVVSGAGDDVAFIIFGACTNP